MVKKLQQNIVTVNDFTNKYSHGHGTTPGLFLLKYISRHGATETMTPKDDEQLQDFVTKYISRKEATEQAIKERQSAYALSQVLTSPLDGRAFGNLGDSYSEDELRSSAQLVQDRWDEGHTVQKMVVSFNTEYLKQVGVLPSNFNMCQRGDAKGNLDQMKLRHALNEGMKRYTKQGKFNNPVWTGSIQVDTLHVHAHIVVVDDCDVADSNRLMPDGVQERGKINKREKEALRKGINHELQDMKPLYQLHHQVDYERDNILSNVDTLLSQQNIIDTELNQIVASLPQDHNLWSINNHSKVMRKPNGLMRNYVDSLCDQHKDLLGYDRMEHVMTQYSEIKASIDGGSVQQYQKQGEQQVKNRIANRIYRRLDEEINDQNLSVSTEFIKQEAQDVDEIVEELKKNHKNNQHDNDDMLLYTYRLATYQERMDRHLSKVQQYEDLSDDYQRQAKMNQADESSVALYDHLKMEKRYHMKALDKYRYFSRDFDITSDLKKKRYRDRYQELEKERSTVVTWGKQIGYIDDSDEQDRFEHQLTNLLSESDAQTMLQQRVSDTQTVQDEIVHYFNGGQLSPLSQSSLIDYGNQHADYQDVANKIQSWGTISEQKAFQEAYSSYQDKLCKFERQGFADEMIQANDVIDEYDYQREPLPHHEANVVSMPHMRYDMDHYLSDDYFNTIKGIDLQDLGFDFGVDKEIKLSPQSLSIYKTNADARKRALDDCLLYLQTTQQSTQLVDDVTPEIRLSKSLSDQVSQTGVLKCGIDKQQFLQLESHRNLAVTTSDKTNEMVSSHLQIASDEIRKSIKTTQTQISRDLDL